MIRIAALLTCFNRKTFTLATLESVFAHQTADSLIDVFMVDDTSTDGTPEEVAVRFPQVRILPGTGSLFWNGGMRMAWTEAFRGDYDFYFWINDDIRLEADALDRLLHVSDELRSNGHTRSIVVGSTCDARNGRVTYGGVVHNSRIHPFKYSLVPPSDLPQPCDTMNGNCVLISREASRLTGNLSREFAHSMGDFDYGLRARAAGCSLWVAPGFYGSCSRNALAGTWMDSSLPLGRRWKDIMSPKGLPPREWRVYCRRHAGPLWRIYWVLPYSRILLGSLLRQSS